MKIKSARESGIVLPCILLTGVIIVFVINSMYTDLESFFRTGQLSLFASRRYSEFQLVNTLPNQKQLNPELICLSGEPKNPLESCYFMNNNQSFFDYSTKEPLLEANCVKSPNLNNFDLKNGIENEEDCIISKLEFVQSGQVDANLIVDYLNVGSDTKKIIVNGHAKINVLNLESKLSLQTIGNLQIGSVQSKEEQIQLELISASGNIKIVSDSGNLIYTCHSKKEAILPNIQPCPIIPVDERQIGIFVSAWQRYRE